MAASPGGRRVRLAHDDPRLRYRGAVSLQRGPGWTAAWRLPYEEAALHLPEGGVGRAAMPAGVRVTFRTDARELTCHYQADPAPRLNGLQELPYLDVLCAGRRTTVLLEADGRDRTFRVTGLPGRTATVELWLPTCSQFRLREVVLPSDLTHHLLEPEGLDRLHPSPAGHEVFAERFLARVRHVRRSLCVPVTA